MNEDLSKFVLEFLKLAPRYLISVAFIAGAMLFLPKEWLNYIGLENFTNQNRQWLGLIFLVSTALWGTALATTIWEWFKRKIGQRRVKKQIVQKLKSLTEDEKQILRYYFAKGTRANMLRMENGVVQGLVANRIIFRSASMGNRIEGFAHNITDFAWDYIQSHPDVLDGSTDYYYSNMMERD